MRKQSDLLWTWLIPDAERNTDRSAWIRHGGKWIIFDSLKKVVELAERLSPFLESGEVEGAKYWNKDPSALCVYSLDSKGSGSAHSSTASVQAGTGSGNTTMHGTKTC